MLELKCISTGSTANCYLLTNGKETLIIDMGIKYSQLLMEIDDMDKVVGGVLSHEHTDHNAINRNYRTSDLLEQIGIHIISPENAELYKKYKLGSFEIIPIECFHNVTCYGYVIKIDGKYLYFATDTRKMEKISNIQIDYFVVECNYCEYLCEEAMLKSDTNLTHLNNVLKNHQSLNTLDNYFQNLGYRPNTIITIHKSNTGYFNTSETLFVLRKYADNVFVAKNHTTYKLGE